MKSARQSSHRIVRAIKGGNAPDKYSNARQEADGRGPARIKPITLPFASELSQLRDFDAEERQRRASETVSVNN